MAAGADEKTDEVSPPSWCRPVTIFLGASFIWHAPSSSLQTPFGVVTLTIVGHPTPLTNATLHASHQWLCGVEERCTRGIPDSDFARSPHHTPSEMGLIMARSPLIVSQRSIKIGASLTEP